MTCALAAPPGEAYPHVVPATRKKEKDADLVAGRATTQGTSRFAARFASSFAGDFYRPLPLLQPSASTTDGLLASSIALGTYLGECDAADDARYVTITRHAIESGINLVDTAINYRCQRSECSVGRALARTIEAGTAARDEIIVCTKGGYIPLDETPPASRAEYQALLEREYFSRNVMTPDDVVAGGHCLAPGYLADQIDRSRTNLHVRTIDLYYLHNPEQQLDVVDRQTFRTRMRAAFQLLEEKCAAKQIVAYGCATWNGFRLAPDDRRSLSLVELVELAREVGGQSHHFRVIQLPINLALNEALRAPTQRVGKDTVPLLDAAASLGIAVVASASLMQGQLTRGLPSQLRDAIPGFETDAQRALAFVRSLPIAVALTGMRSTRHLEENLGAGKQPA
ncbi:MAG TPA: aldo/keto reductase [Gemmatimonadaceae bacterium]|nr:aldo/keto reductase [Gemmatimonadaceae bacterium]